MFMLLQGPAGRAVLIRVAGPAGLTRTRAADISAAAIPVLQVVAGICQVRAAVARICRVLVAAVAHMPVPITGNGDLALFLRSPES